ncbi:A/B/D/E cyclin [Rickenella mellea]|uniref:A/B/D/E cyclin n=1 Tax=Rickenella mellea TaxID=50990 RepID=A0A4Y7QC24_9AGAM|nr:A/B/D/E cyclin [Rickenella mellea]
MAVDLPHPPVPIVLVPAPPATRKAAARSSTTTTTTTTAVFRRPSIQKKPSLRAKEEPAEEEPELKRRRTSSEAPDEPLETLDRESNDIAAVDAGLAADNDEGWDDLDREDDDDPLMVSEYVVEIFNYLKEVELKTMPNPNYIENQKELAWKMRGILMDWLIQVHTRFRLLPETLFLCVNIIDRFLSARVVSLAKLQLVGVTCMFIAAKVEETVSPTVSNFIYCADSSYTEAEILQAEKYVLKTIDWNLSFPSPLNFLRRISKADEFNPQVRTIGKYLLEISCLEWRLLPAPPSLMAAASMWLAKLILDQPEWTPNLRHYSSYPEHALIPTANIMINYLLKPVSHESFFKKYASKRFMKASLFVREWVLDRWEERAQVDLMEEVPRLKAAALARQPIAAQEY